MKLVLGVALIGAATAFGAAPPAAKADDPESKTTISVEDAKPTLLTISLSDLLPTSPIKLSNNASGPIEIYPLSATVDQRAASACTLEVADSSLQGFLGRCPSRLLRPVWKGETVKFAISKKDSIKYSILELKPVRRYAGKSTVIQAKPESTDKKGWTNVIPEHLSVLPALCYVLLDTPRALSCQSKNITGDESVIAAARAALDDGQTLSLVMKVHDPDDPDGGWRRFDFQNAPEGKAKAKPQPRSAGNDLFSRCLAAAQTHADSEKSFFAICADMHPNSTGLLSLECEGTKRRVPDDDEIIDAKATLQISKRTLKAAEWSLSNLEMAEAEANDKAKAKTSEAEKLEREGNARAAHDKTERAREATKAAQDDVKNRQTRVDAAEEKRLEKRSCSDVGDLVRTNRTFTVYVWHPDSFSATVKFSGIRGVSDGVYVQKGLAEDLKTEMKTSALIEETPRDEGPTPPQHVESFGPRRAGSADLSITTSNGATPPVGLKIETTYSVEDYFWVALRLGVNFNSMPFARKYGPRTSPTGQRYVEVTEGSDSGLFSTSLMFGATFFFWDVRDKSMKPVLGFGLRIAIAGLSGSEVKVFDLALAGVELGFGTDFSIGVFGGIAYNPIPANGFKQGNVLAPDATVQTQFAFTPAFSIGLTFTPDFMKILGRAP